jgi:hypothetical protein
MGTDGQLAKQEWDELVAYFAKARQAEIDAHRGVAKARVSLTAKKLEKVAAFARKDCTDTKKLKRLEGSIKKLQNDLQIVEDTFFDELSYKTTRDWRDTMAFCELAGCAPDEVQANADLNKIMVEDETEVLALRADAEVDDVEDEDEDEELEEDDEELEEDEVAEDPRQGKLFPGAPKVPAEMAAAISAPSERAPVIQLDQRREKKTVPPPGPAPAPIPKKVAETLPVIPEGMDVAVDFFPLNPAGGARRNEMSLVQRQNVLDIISDRSVSGIRVQTLGESTETRMTSDSAQRMLRTWILLMVQNGYLNILNPEEKGWKYAPGERFAEARRKLRVAIDKSTAPAQEA